MKAIFVPVADRPECINALNIAFDLAQTIDANVVGCHIRDHRDSDVTLTDSFDGTGESTAQTDVAINSDVTKNNSSAAQHAFVNIADRKNFPVIKKPGSKTGAVWLEKVGSPPKVFSIMGPLADLIVVSRPAVKNSTKTDKLGHVYMMTALLNSSSPVLILPQKAKSQIGKRISIAWNQSTDATHAVKAAIPLLQAADEVNIITCDGESAAGPKAGQLSNYLEYWGIKTTHIKTKGSNDADAVIKAYKESSSDLLVMGAYSRSRLRQRVFGGVSEHMLYKSNIPIFMLHS